MNNIIRDKKWQNNILKHFLRASINLYYYENDPFLMSRINSNYTQVEIADGQNERRNECEPRLLHDRQGAFLQRWRTA